MQCWKEKQIQCKHNAATIGLQPFQITQPGAWQRAASSLPATVPVPNPNPTATRSAAWLADRHEACCSGGRSSRSSWPTVGGQRGQNQPGGPEGSCPLVAGAQLAGSPGLGMSNSPRESQMQQHSCSALPRPSS